VARLGGVDQLSFKGYQGGQGKNGMGPAIAIMAAAAAAANPQTPALGALNGLSGCWNAPGEVLGKRADSVARGDWHLGHRYFMLHLSTPNGKPPYEAALLYGGGVTPEAITAFWMDSFGGAYSTSGKGAVTSNGFDVVYTYPDSVYVNHFQRSGKGWTWTIIEKVPNKPERQFARYDLRPASCTGNAFTF
jgi:hypothetical protein